MSFNLQYIKHKPMIAGPDSSSGQRIVGFGYLFELLWQNQIPQELFFSWFLR